MLALVPLLLVASLVALCSDSQLEFTRAPTSNCARLLLRVLMRPFADYLSGFLVSNPCSFPPVVYSKDSFMYNSKGTYFLTTKNRSESRHFPPTPLNTKAHHLLGFPWSIYLGPCELAIRCFLEQFSGAPFCYLQTPLSICSQIEFLRKFRKSPYFPTTKNRRDSRPFLPTKPKAHLYCNLTLLRSLSGPFFSVKESSHPNE
jgi:hypothetical protein